MCIWVCAYSCVHECVCVHSLVYESGRMHTIVCVCKGQRTSGISSHLAPFWGGVPIVHCCTQATLPVGVQDVSVSGSPLFTLHTGYPLIRWKMSRMSLPPPSHLTQEDYRHRLPHLNFAWVLENWTWVFTLGQHTLYSLSDLPSLYVNEF